MKPILCPLLGWIWSGFCPAATPAPPTESGPTCESFTVDIYSSGRIDFASKLSSVLYGFSSIQVKPNSTPGKGTLVGSSSETLYVGTAYSNTAIYYTSNEEYCSSDTTDGFVFFPHTTVDGGSCTVTINNKTFNCKPKNSNQSLSISGTGQIVFTDYISDNETATADLQIYFNSLPTEGTLSVDGSSAAINTWYSHSNIVFTSREIQCTNSYTVSFTYKIKDASGDESGNATISINATTFNCAPTSANMSVSITDYATLDFASYISDNEDADSNLQIQFTSLPSRGIITYSGGNVAVSNTSTTSNSLVYTSNPDECLNTYTESIYWKVVDEGGRESSLATLTFSANSFNCRPVANNITLTTTGNPYLYSLDFTGSISDHEDSISNLTIKVEILPSSGSLSVSGDSITANVAYANSVLVYNPNAS